MGGRNRVKGEVRSIRLKFRGCGMNPYNFNGM